MTVSRILAENGQPHGTVITADYQEAGRGRMTGSGSARNWETEKGKNLAFTVLLRYAHISLIPCGLTLRAGLAAALAVEDFLPALKGRALLKWPNDIMLGSKKVCGILSEAEDNIVYLGIGINVCQTVFPPHLQNKAASIASASGMEIDPQTRYALLEKILLRLFSGLEAHSGAAAGIVPDSAASAPDWRSSINGRLYKKNEQVTFIPGTAGSASAITGRLAGIGPSGELLLLPDNTDAPQAFFSGELLVY